MHTLKDVVVSNTQTSSPLTDPISIILILIIIVSLMILFNLYRKSRQ